MADILICDDNLEIIDILTVQLKSAGHRVKTVAHGKDVIMMNKRMKFDLVISDIDMPQWTGLDVMAELDKTNDCKVAILSAHEEDEMLSKIRSMPNFCGHIKKPWSAADVLKLVADNCPPKSD